MQYTTLILAAVSGLAAAQTATNSAAAPGSTCAAQNTQPRLDKCGGNDWNCLCAAATDVATCYNNCPGHPDQYGAQQKVTQYCNAAKQYGSSTSAGATASAKVPETAPASASATETGTGTGTATGAAATGASATGSGATAGMAPTGGATAGAGGNAMPYSYTVFGAILFLLFL